MGVYYFYSDRIYKDGNWESKCVQVEDDKFTRFITSSQTRKEMLVEGFWVGPGRVYVDIEAPVYRQINPEQIIKKYVIQGCTLLLCQMPVKSSLHYKNIFSQFRARLSRLPIDYMIVPRVPLSLLKVDLIRYFGRNRVPFILVEVNNKEALKATKWEWIRQAQQLTDIPIVCMFMGELQLDKAAGTLWKKITAYHHISSFVLTEQPLAVEALRLTGISPYKGEILDNVCADYNLYPLDKAPSIDEQPKFSYDKAIPAVTVTKGKVIKSGLELYLKGNQGQYKQVSIPKHFV